MTSYRGIEWRAFADRVEDHIDTYTVPQYGDMPHDRASSMTAAECIGEVKKYLARFGRGQRGPDEQRRDMLKIAHYACIAHTKLLSETQVEEECQ